MVAIRVDTKRVKDDENKPINFSRQQMVAVLGIKGEGKSYLTEALAEEEFDNGVLCLDLHGAGNGENAFWALPNEKGQRYPITIISSESLTFDQTRLDIFNGKRYSEKEWYEIYPYEKYHKLYDPVYPQEKPSVEQEWIKIVRLPPVTKKGNSEADKKAKEIIFHTLIDCKHKRRWFVMNQMFFSSEEQFFWTQELIIRSLAEFQNKHGRRIEPQDVGCETREQMKPVERNWERMCLVTRELWELTPSRTKHDKSGESLSTKKAYLGLAKVCRQWNIDWIADWQQYTTVEEPVRTQFDVRCLKRYSEYLGGEELLPIFRKIKTERERIITEGNYKRNAFLTADSLFPEIQKLAQEYYYVWFTSEKLLCLPVPELKHMHKEPYHNINVLIGVEFTHGKTMQTDQKQDETDPNNLKTKELFSFCYVRRFPKKGKKKGWKLILQDIAKEQDQGRFTWFQDATKTTDGTISKQFSRWMKDFTPPEEELYEKNVVKT